MRSAGIDLQPYIDKGLLQCHASRPSLGGLEMHLALMLKAIRDFSPAVVIVDPLSSLLASGTGYQSAGMMLRLVDYIKSKNVTALFLSLQNEEDHTEMHISSITHGLWFGTCVPTSNSRAACTSSRHEEWRTQIKCDEWKSLARECA
jgi:circadian clock protein KaiC